MRMVWLLIGILVAVGIFLFYPNAWNSLVSGVQWIFKTAGGWFNNQNVTNITGGK